MDKETTVKIMKGQIEYHKGCIDAVELQSKMRKMERQTRVGTLIHGSSTGTVKFGGRRGAGNGISACRAAELVRNSERSRGLHNSQSTTSVDQAAKQRRQRQLSGSTVKHAIFGGVDGARKIEKLRDRKTRLPWPMCPRCRRAACAGCVLRNG
jgi:hypothetical protein